MDTTWANQHQESVRLTVEDLPGLEPAVEDGQQRLCGEPNLMLHQLRRCQWRVSLNYILALLAGGILCFTKTLRGTAHFAHLRPSSSGGGQYWKHPTWAAKTIDEAYFLLDCGGVFD